ncbi:tetratricopeptide repeat protein [Alicyclobacillus dauci]|uniref:Tetratricopeptide repeat protein n=1 Tax=Alicyclobacillus dauci TaxID=1475485 RepID=A0ABY6Z4S1_9BACL|nr:hypothetical protein [Alicyclobacillus dauci]WAH37765.1 tetratricopeptide repeat protein [Alicyclobacillus dauci]
MVHINNSLLEMAYRTNDNSIIQQAWRTSFQFKSLKDMCKCILIWYKTKDVSTEFVQALLETVYLGSNHDSFCEEYWEVLLCVPNTYYRKSLYEEAVHEYKRLLNLYPPLLIRFRSLVNLGSTWLELKNYGEAHLAFTEALKHSVKRDVIFGRIHQGLGITSRQLGLWQDAMNHTAIASETFLNAQDLTRYNYTKVNRAVLLLDNGILTEAFILLQESYKFCEKQDDFEGVSKICEEFARYYFYNTNYELTLYWSNVGLDFVDRDYNTSARLLTWKLFSYVKKNLIQLAMDSIRVIKSLLGRNCEDLLLSIDPNMDTEFKLDIRRMIEGVKYFV